MESEIYQRIPHRPPFLWIDTIIYLDNDQVVVEKHFPKDLDICRGHYPGHPIIPGVILCESVFQAGALLISKHTHGSDNKEGVPVLTRIYGARFKREVNPGKTVTVRVRFKEIIGGAFLMKGKVLIEDKVAVSVDFACAMATDSIN